MLSAAKHRKDRHLKFYEDEITSIIFGPLMYMPPEDVWALFRAWLPFQDELWPAEVSDGMVLSFWPNLASGGRIEPDILVRFMVICAGKMAICTALLHEKDYIFQCQNELRYFYCVKTHPCFHWAYYILARYRTNRSA